MYQKKSLGQNFLKSPKIVADIVSASGVKDNETVLEIGPGEGVLTAELLRTGAHVISVEKDDRLIPILSEKFKKEIDLGKLKLVHTDILNLQRETFLPSKVAYRVVANIPYYITGQIIRMFLESTNQPESMTLLLQKEVAKRVVARDKKESLLSLSVKAYGMPTYIRTVGRGAFSPSPNVDSAVLHIANISKSSFKDVNEKKFFEILHAGFAHKRKQLLPNLSSLYTKDAIARAFSICHLDLHCRAEDISISKWLELINILQK